MESLQPRPGRYRGWWGQVVVTAALTRVTVNLTGPASRAPDALAPGVGRTAEHDLGQVLLEGRRTYVPLPGTTYAKPSSTSKPIARSAVPRATPYSCTSRVADGIGRSGGRVPSSIA